MPTGSQYKDSCILPSGKLVDIQGLPNELKLSKLDGRASGHVTLNIEGATISNGVLTVPRSARVETTDIGHFSNGRDLSDRRSLQTIGTKKVFVIRAIAPDASTTKNMNEISDKVFGTGTDIVNLKSQFAACSYNKLLFEPVIDTFGDYSITNGVGEVNIGTNVNGIADGVIRDAMLAAADEKYGNLNSLVNNGDIDHVMLCLPPGTSGNWLAYAYINFWLSVYNDLWCNYPSTQMHEMGHNLGLAHSGELSEYDDTSSMMGFSYGQDESPLMCFNAAKNWQLGWYEDARYIFKPFEQAPYTGNLIGICDYGTTSDIVMIKIEGYATLDYYVSFNRQSGINSETREGGDQVLVHSRGPGGYVTSDLIAKLNAGGIYTITETGQESTTISILSINTSTSPAIAVVQIDGPTTSAPTQSPITPAPTSPPTSGPTNGTTNAPINVSTNPPTFAVINPPTPSPTSFLIPPTSAPTNGPTTNPTNAPTNGPTPNPTILLTPRPTDNITPVPTRNPTFAPTRSPTKAQTCSRRKQPCKKNSDCCTKKKRACHRRKKWCRR